MLYRGYLLLLLLAMLWSPSFAFMKIASIDYPPVTIAATRISLAALLLYIICYLRKDLPPKNAKLWCHATVLGIFSAGLPFILFAYATKYMFTMWGGFFTGTIPLITAILSHYFLTNEKLNLWKILGIISGLLGIALLTVPAILNHNNNQGVNFNAAIACFAGTFCYALGMVYSKKYFNIAGIQGPMMQLSTATIWLLPLSIIIDNPWTIHYSSIYPTLSLIALAIFCTASAFIIYFFINKNFGASFLGMIGFPLPILSTLIGIWIFNEPLTLSFCISLILVTLGMILMNRKFGIAKTYLENPYIPTTEEN